MAGSVDAAHRTVVEWLTRVYGNASAPRFELNARNIERLAQLAHTSTRRDEELASLTEDLAAKRKEYEREEARLRQQLSFLGLTPTEFSASCHNSLNALSQLADQLALKDTSDTSLIAAEIVVSSVQRWKEKAVAQWYIVGLQRHSLEVADIQDQLQDIETRNRALEGDLELTEGQLTACQSMAQELAERVELQARRSAQRLERCEFLEKKAAGYAQQVSVLRLQLLQQGFDDRFTHAALTRRAQQVEELQAASDQLVSSVQRYRQLPPDVLLAKLAVEQARDQLRKLDEEIAHRVDLLYT